MNQLDEQKSLIEYLETALEEVTSRESGATQKLAELEQELKSARLEYGRLLHNQRAQLEVKSSVSPPPSPQPQVQQSEEEDDSPALRLFVPLNADSRWKVLLESWKAAFGKGEKVYRITAQPIEAHLLLEEGSKWKIFSANVKSIFGKEKKNYSGITATPVTSDLLLEQESVFKNLKADLKALFTHRQASDYNISAQPLEVDEIFREYKFRSSSVLVSAFLHVFVITLIIVGPLLLIGRQKVKPTSTEVSLLDPSAMILNLPPAADKSGGGGGGGDQSKTPPSLGKLPRASDRQFTPPTTKVINLDPLLPMEPTVVAPQLAQLPTVNLSEFGDPLSGIPGPPSNGPGMYGGIGTGSGGGVGSGRGAGVGPGEGGGFGGGVYRVGGGVSSPIVIYRVEPIYSEEARKAKYQGVVVLQAIVRKDGNIEILKVVRGLGLGLDENAIAALKQWKFRPATRNGVPVDVALNIEVNFSLR